MKRIFLLCVVLLGGCATVSAPNPLTYSRLYEVENAYGIALTLAKAYRVRPLCHKGQTFAHDLCAERAVVLQLQAADRNVQRVLKNVRAFAKNSPSLDSSSLISEVAAAVATIQQIEQASGVK